MKLVRLLAILLAFALPGQAFGQAQLLPPGEQCFQANSGLTGMVGLLGNITPGSGYTNGTYPGQALTGGTGSQATANITVAGGQVTAVAIVNPGTQYTVGDVLTATLPGGGGFSVPIASTTINSSLAGGSVSYYIPNTLVFKNTWKDSAQSQLNTNPVQLDQNGCAVVYGLGSYRQILKDSLGNTIWDQNTSDYSSENSPYWAGLSGGTPNNITVVNPNFLAIDGQSISFKALNTNTGAATLDASGFGALPILKDTESGPVALTGGEIVSGNILVVTYDASLFSFHIIQGAQEPANTSSIVAYGQGRFAFSSGISAKLCPVNGNKITFPDGKIASIPSGCFNANPAATTINGAASALTVGQQYYAYLWNNSGAFSIDFSQDPHGPDSSTGIEIRVGDPTRVLVGLVYVVTGPNFADQDNQRYVASWFNRQPKSLRSIFSSDRTTTSTSFVEVDPEIRINFVTWGDGISVAYAGPTSNNTNSANITSRIGLDGISTLLAYAFSQQSVLANQTQHGIGDAQTPAEGHHYFTLAGKVSGGTGTWGANSALSGIVRQ